MKKHIFQSLLLLISVASLFSCGSPSTNDIKLAQLPVATSIVTHVADQQGFYKAAGVNCTIVSEPAGPAVVAALRSHDESSPVCGTIAITPTVAMIGAKQKPVIIATTLFSTSEVKIVSFKNSNLKPDMQSFKGKKIGLVRNTIGDVYFSMFLKKIHLTPQDVTIVNGKPGDIKKLLLNKNIDAAVLWSPFVTQCIKEAKKQGNSSNNEVVAFNDSTLYTVSLQIVTTQEKLSKNRPVLVKFLRGLISADQYINQHPTKVQAEFEKWLGLDADELNDFMKQTKFTVSLNVPQTKQFLMNELTWLRENNKDAFVPGDVSEFVDASLLKEVDAKRVKE